MPKKTARPPRKTAAKPKPTSPRKPKKAKRRHVKAVPVHSSGGFVTARFADGPKLLLIKNIFDNRWAVPKGHVDPGETSEQAAIREIKEETGLDAAIRKPLGKNTYYFRGLRGPEKGKTVRKTVDMYLLEAIGDTTIYPEKLDPHDKLVKEARWFSPDEAVSAIPYANLRPLAKKAARMVREGEQETHG